MLSSAQAAIQSTFTPIGVAILQIRIPSGADPDQDTQILWDSMLVPPQDSFAGPGKGIKSDGKELKFVCNKKGGTNDLCVITINANGKQSSRWVEVDQGRQWARLHVEGTEADFFSEKFKGPFESADGKLRIFSAPGLFDIQFSGKGF